MHDDNIQQGHNYPGSKGDYTERLQFLRPSEYNGISVYRVLDNEGQVGHTCFTHLTNESFKPFTIIAYRS